MNLNKKIIENIKTIFFALIIAIFIRSFFFQPFYIPSSSMEPNLLIGDRLFVSKYSYGYSRHSFPFSPNIFKGRILFDEPIRGDVVVFKTPADNRTDYIKRLIGLPGDKVQFIDGHLFINNSQIFLNKTDIISKIYCGNLVFETNLFHEQLKSDVKYNVVYSLNNTFNNSDVFKVPVDHYFFLGDNRDCSKDSRFLSDVGYVHRDNLVGKARFVWLSSDYRIGSIFKFWDWKNIIRFNRFFKTIK
ncbi:signal peptidase I [Candidatus Pelagibacter sp.]|nr:signal peptidase I [Candidatus Pelagibacter sp.]